MLRILLLALSLAFFALGLTGCASNGSSSGFSMFGHHDPDGDGDAKGSGHFPAHRKATGRKVFIFNPNHGSWAAYDGSGKRVNTGRGSGGKSYCPDLGRSCRTVIGTFRINRKGDGSCVSGKFPLETNGGAPMPYCMHFGSKGYALHGSSHVPDYNASHGCIRVSPTVARWLNGFLNVGSTIIVRPY
ncbi:MAG: L,D-transpeptidase [Gammaproteobacteria bacterium]|nr:L,D-transpeptidase [Gammaproteobacteria bacterium]